MRADLVPKAQEGRGGMAWFHRREQETSLLPEFFHLVRKELLLAPIALLRSVLRRACQFRLKIPHCTGRKFPTPELHEWASLASDGVEPSAVFWRVLGVTDSEAKERAEASAPSCPRGGTRPALRRSFSR